MQCEAPAVSCPEVASQKDTDLCSPVSRGTAGSSVVKGYAPHSNPLLCANSPRQGAWLQTTLLHINSHRSNRQMGGSVP